MVKYCPSCGTKFEQEFNFCPSCGFDLRNISNTKNNEGKESAQQLEGIICDNCGEENQPGNIICTYCGAPLKGAAIVKQVSEAKYIKVKPVTEKRKERKAESPAAKKPTIKSTNLKEIKVLDQKKLLIILAGVVIVVFVILLFSGVLNTPAPEGDVQNQVTDQGSGVNLNNIQQINEMEKKVKDNPDDTEALLELAHLKNDSGMFEQAIVDYQKYLEKVPKDPDARIDMGVCYYNLKNYSEAIKQMETAIKYSPGHQIGYLNLGIVNLAAGNLDKSKEWLQKAVEIDPNTEMGKRAKELLDSHSK